MPACPDAAKALPKPLPVQHLSAMLLASPPSLVLRRQLLAGKSDLWPSGLWEAVAHAVGRLETEQLLAEELVAPLA